MELIYSHIMDENLSKISSPFVSISSVFPVAEWESFKAWSIFFFFLLLIFKKTTTNLCHLWHVLTFGQLSVTWEKIDIMLSEPFPQPANIRGLCWEKKGVHFSKGSVISEFYSKFQSKIIDSAWTFLNSFLNFPCPLLPKLPPQQSSLLKWHWKYDPTLDDGSD